MRSNTNFGPPFFTVDYLLVAGTVPLAAAPPTPNHFSVPAAPAAGSIPFAGAKDGQQIIVTANKAFDDGLTLEQARVVPPTVVGGVVTVPGCIILKFANTTGAALPSVGTGDITFHIEVVPLASE